MGVQSPSTLPSVCIDPLNPLRIGLQNTDGSSKSLYIFHESNTPPKIELSEDE